MKNLLIFFPYFAVDRFFSNRNRDEWEILPAVELAQLGVFGIIKFIRKQKRDTFVIGRPDLKTVEVKYYLEVIMLLARAQDKFMTSNEETVRRISKSKFFLFDTPKIIIEAILSAILIGITYGILSALLVYYKLTQNRNFTPQQTKKIAFIRADDFGAISAGGSFTHIAGFRDGIEQLGYSIHFIAPEAPTILESTDQFSLIPYPKRFNAPEIPEIYFAYRMFFRAYKLLKNDRPAFIYQRDCAFNAFVPLLARLLKIPHILEFNGSEVWVKEKWGRLFLRNLGYYFEKVAHLGADRICVVSQVLKDELVDKGIPEDKVIVNPNGVDPDKFRPHRGGSFIRNTTPQNSSHSVAVNKKIVLGFIGSFGPWHGVDILAKAIKPAVEKNPNLHFLIIGDGALKPYVEKQIHHDNVQEYVTLTGNIPHAKSPEYLASCDILLSPHVPNVDGTRFFGSPTKIFEYMAVGRAIIASDLEQIGTVFEHNKTAILITPGSVEELVQAILYLADNPELREKLGAAARETVTAQYTWKRNAQRVIDTFSSLK